MIEADEQLTIGSTVVEIRKGCIYIYAIFSVIIINYKVMASGS